MPRRARRRDIQKQRKWLVKPPGEAYPEPTGSQSCARGVISAMRFLKQMLLLAGVGACLGFLAWSLMGQGAVSILFGSLGGTFTCKADVEHALQEFVKFQIYCALAGAVALPLLTWIIRRSFGKKSKPVAIQPTGPGNE